MRWELNTAHEDVNSLGFRGGEVSPLKGEGVVRILCLGDSVTHGMTMETEKTFSAVLERLLAGRFLPGRFEVINGGVPGYTTDQELAFLEENGLDLHPDIVIVGFVLNDVIDRLHHPIWISRGERFMQNYCALYYCLRAVYLEARKRIARRRTPENIKNLVMSGDDAPREMKEVWELVLSDLGSIQEVCRKSGAHFLLVVFPCTYQLAEPPEKAAAQQKILIYCRERGIHVIDVLTAFREKERGGVSLFSDDLHLSERGHRETAKEIMNALASKGILGPKG